MSTTNTTGLEVRVFSGLCALAPVMSFFAPRGLSVLAIVFGLFLLGRAVVRKELPRVSKPFFYSLALICALALISVTWSLDTWFSIRGALKLIGHALIGYVMIDFAKNIDARQSGIVLCALGIGFALTVILLATETLFQVPLSQWARGEVMVDKAETYGYFWLNACGSFLAIIVWPLALSLWRRHGPLSAVLLLAMSAYAIYLFEYRAGMIAIGAGFFIALVMYVFQKKAVRFFALVFSIGVLLAPLAPDTILRPDILKEASPDIQRALTSRLYSWQFSAEKISEHPVRGWGMNASRTIPGGEATIVHPFRGHYTYMQLHPHNMILQVWLELGLGGALLLCVLGSNIIILGIGAVERHRASSAAAIGQFGAAMAIYSGSYSAWSSWWIAALWIAAVLMIISMQRFEYVENS
jgi:exopolysaccharide production protein ExoQ